MLITNIFPPSEGFQINYGMRLKKYYQKEKPSNTAG